jgi:putative transposase
LGHYFKLVVDNKAVSFIKNKKDLNGRLARHALYLQEFDFDIVFRPRNKNTLADFLSRYPKDHELVDGKNITQNEISEHEDKINLTNNLKICAINTAESDKNYNYLILEQQKDNELKYIIGYLNNIESKDKSSKEFKYITKNYTIKNNLVCKFNSDANVAQFLICVPKSMYFNILENYHDLNTSGHLGLKRTLNKLKERFFWPQMSKFIAQYIKTCKQCQSRKKPKTRATGLMQAIITGNVFEMVAIDHLRPLVRSNGCEYIIVLTDYFSKFAVCKAIAKNNARTAAKFIFEDLICTYGRIPERILSDRSQSFIGKVVSHLNILLGIKQTKTSGYRPSNV